MSSKSSYKKPRRVVCGIYLDEQLADAAELAQQVYEAARLEQERTKARRIAEYAAAGEDTTIVLHAVQDEDTRVLAPLADRVDETLRDLDEATEWFVFESIGHRRLQALVKRYPPTEEQKADAAAQGQELAWDPDLFPRALCEDSCVAPDDVDWDAVFAVSDEVGGDGLPPKSAWSKSDVEALIAHAINANQSLRLADKARYVKPVA